MTTEKEDQPRAARRADDEARVLFLQVPLPRRVATRASRTISYPKGLLMVTPRAADVTALSVTGQISRLTSRLEPTASLAGTPSALHERPCERPRQFGHAAECESEWSMDWVT